MAQIVIQWLVVGLVGATLATNCTDDGIFFLRYDKLPYTKANSSCTTLGAMLADTAEGQIGAFLVNLRDNPACRPFFVEDTYWIKSNGINNSLPLKMNEASFLAAEPTFKPHPYICQRIPLTASTTTPPTTVTTKPTTLSKTATPAAMTQSTTKASVTPTSVTTQWLTTPKTTTTAAFAPTTTTNVKPTTSTTVVKPTISTTTPTTKLSTQTPTPFRGSKMHHRLFNIQPGKVRAVPTAAKDVSAVNLLDCAVSCTSNIDCAGANYRDPDRVTGSNSAKGICRMFLTSVNPSNLATDREWDYIGT